MQLQGESATWTWADLLAQAGPGLDRFAAEFAASGALRDGVLAATFDEWAALGVPPETGEDEHLETWALLQEAMLFATVGGTQSVAVRSIGFVGATGASLQVVVDGVDATGWAGFPSLPPNIVPAPPVAHALLLARSTAESRPAQLARWSRLSTHLALLQRWLPGRFAVDIDPHLAGLRVRSPDHFALAWVPGNNARIASLQLSEVQSDGQRQPLDLGSLDAASGVVSASANEPILLPPNIAAVAARARVRQRRLASTVSDELADPARVIPEGVDVDGLLDLSDYAERVIGFERYKRADKPLIHDPSGIDWSAPPDESAFLHLPFRREGEPPTLVPVSTEADAREMLSTVEAALAGSSASPAITFAGHQIVPTAQLRETLGRAIRLSEERRSHEERGAPLPRAGPLAAVLAELNPSQTFDEDGPTVDEASVPFARLAQLLLSGVTLKPHQRRGVAWLWHHASHGEPGVLLADDMGLGKTLQVAALLALRDSRPETGPHLVVAPTILLHTWQGEFARFFRPEVFEPLCVLHGDSLRGLRRGDGLDTDSIGRARLVLTNYETLGAHQKSLLKVPFSVVVFDEAQALKNESTLRSRGAQGLKRELAIGMTGTPVENKLSDLWALFEALQQRPERRAFGRRAHFETAYESQGAAGVASVRARLRFPSAHSVVLRREKAQALRDLPPKFFHEVPVEMTGHRVEFGASDRKGDAREGCFWRARQTAQALPAPSAGHGAPIVWRSTLLQR